MRTFIVAESPENHRQPLSQLFALRGYKEEIKENIHHKPLRRLRTLPNITISLGKASTWKKLSAGQNHLSQINNSVTSD